MKPPHHDDALVSSTNKSSTSKRSKQTEWVKCESLSFSAIDERAESLEVRKTWEVRPDSSSVCEGWVNDEESIATHRSRVDRSFNLVCSTPRPQIPLEAQEVEWVEKSVRFNALDFLVDEFKSRRKENESAGGTMLTASQNVYQQREKKRENRNFINFFLKKVKITKETKPQQEPRLEVSSKCVYIHPPNSPTKSISPRNQKNKAKNRRVARHQGIKTEALSSVALGNSMDSDS